MEKLGKIKEAQKTTMKGVLKRNFFKKLVNISKVNVAAIKAIENMAQMNEFNWQHFVRQEDGTLSPINDIDSMTLEQT